MNSNSIALDCNGSNLRDHGIEAHSSPAAGSGVIVHGTSFEQEYYLIYLWWTNIHMHSKLGVTQEWVVYQLESQWINPRFLKSACWNTLRKDTEAQVAPNELLGVWMLEIMLDQSTEWMCVWLGERSAE